jgi:maltose O-acetyltransferase
MGRIRDRVASLPRARLTSTAAERALLRTVIREEFDPLRPIMLITALTRLLPDHSMIRVRLRILRTAGWNLGPSITMCDVPRLVGGGRIQDRLTVGPDTFINVGCTFELTDQLTIGERVDVGHEVLLLTSTHQIGMAERRAGISYSAPVWVGDGVWLGSRSIVMPGVTIGDGAIVAAGAVVLHDVAPDTVVAGVPAKVVRSLDELSDPTDAAMARRLRAVRPVRSAG